MMKNFLLIGLLALSGCTQVNTTTNTKGDFRGAHVGGDASVIVGVKPSVSNSVTVALPVGDSVVNALFPKGLKQVNAGDVEAAKEAVSETVPEAAQPAVEAKLDQCANAIDAGGTCNVKAK